MVGSWRWNAVFGLLGVILTIMFSFQSNLPEIVAIRSGYAFISFFVVAYGVRAIFTQIFKPPALTTAEEQAEASHSGTVDLVTPDETDELNEMLKPQSPGSSESKTEETNHSAISERAEFKPLNPPQFATSKNSEPEELAKAIRHLTGE